MTRRLGLVVLVLAGGAFLLGGCPAADTLSFRASESFDLGTPFAADGSLTVDWRNGSVTVRVDDTATEIKATGTKYATAALQTLADAALDDISITLTGSGGHARLRFDAPVLDPPQHGADVEIVLPAGIKLTIESANGNVTVRGNVGQTRIELANGGVRVANNDGDTHIALGNGDITVARQSGDLEISSGNGVVDVTSDAGDVEVALGTGDIVIDAHPAAEGRVEAHAATGTVRVRVPTDFAASIELGTSPAGDVSVDFSDFTVTNREQTGRYKLSAILNGGGGEIIGEVGIGTVRFGGL